MAQTQITLTTEQAAGLNEILTATKAEAERLVEAAAQATERRRPGMLAKSEALTARADLLESVLNQVPENIINPPAPPAWVADRVALLDGLVYVATGENAWATPTADGVKTTEELQAAGATRLTLGGDAVAAPAPVTKPAEPAEQAPVENDQIEGQMELDLEEQAELEAVLAGEDADLFSDQEIEIRGALGHHDED